MKRMKWILAVVSLLLLAVSAAGAAQAADPTTMRVQKAGDNPMYTITINVVERRTTAINYQHRNGATKIDFRGTPLMEGAHGQAKVESKQGYIEVEVEFRNLQSATRFGPEFLTYVLWAITPEGRAKNLGEVIRNGTSSKLDVTTELQAFGLIVTAEPYFAVTQPSDVVVMENFARADTAGKIEVVNAKYELLKRGQYTVNVLPAELQPMKLDKNTPLDLYEARNAVRIAKWAGADVDAKESFQKANQLLVQAEAYKVRKASSRSIAMASREAVQTAEDARLIALKNQADTRLENERAASANRVVQANTAASEARADANEAGRARARAELDRAMAQAQAERTKSESDLAAQRAAADAKALAERTQLDSEMAAERATRDKEAAVAASELARKTAADQAEREKHELRLKLADQLGRILETRDSARGLIVNMSDVLFDTGKYELKPGARVKLAKISGIILAYPTLKLEVEGHTDSVGSNELNMKLSDRRAGAVRDFLMNQGVAGDSISAHGFGEDQPVATNDTASGRQQNRRVEMVVSGDVIGTSMGPKNQ
jgi:outer membrane protein OmpA-like peptidoglycan-associated protein